MGCSSRAPGLQLYGGSQPPVISVPGYTMLSFSSLVRLLYSCGTHKLTQAHTYVHKGKKKSNAYKELLIFIFYTQKTLGTKVLNMKLALGV